MSWVFLGSVKCIIAYCGSIKVPYLLMQCWTHYGCYGITSAQLQGKHEKRATLVVFEHTSYSMKIVVSHGSC